MAAGRQTLSTRSSGESPRPVSCHVRYLCMLSRLFGLHVHRLGLCHQMRWSVIYSHAATVLETKAKRTGPVKK